MDQRKFYIRVKGKRQGPFSPEELHDQHITASTPVWCTGMAGWTKAGEVPELYELVSSLPPGSSRKKFIIPAIVLLVLIIAGAVWGKDLFTPKKQEVQTEQVYNNQQLYTNYSPGTVLIEHKYYYQITAAGNKYFFNNFYDADDYMFLDGLTDDEGKAASLAEPIQGTGFFISEDGKVLTNRHVAPGDPTGDEAASIERAFIKQLSNTSDQKKEIDSIRSLKLGYDTTLIALYADSIANAADIAKLKEKIADAEELLNESAFGPLSFKVDDSTINAITTGGIVIKKITAELEVFMPGTVEIEKGKGTACDIIAISADPDIDLAVIQTKDHQLPIMGLKLADLSRIEKTKDLNDVPLMTERLIMIGYNQGTIISNTSEGIKPQLTEGKISQNTDSYKLMYTIPALPGSSGSPVLDEKGRLVSVNFAGISNTQSFNYGLQPARIREFLKTFRII